MPRFAVVEEVRPGFFLAVEVVYQRGRWLVGAALRHSNDCAWLESWLARRGFVALS